MSGRIRDCVPQALNLRTEWKDDAGESSIKIFVVVILWCGFILQCVFSLLLVGVEQWHFCNDSVYNERGTLRNV